MTSGTVHLSTCGDLTQGNTTYILDSDVRSEGTCFRIQANNVTLDLNGHTVLYDDYPSAGLANADFETGSGGVPADWDLSQAPTAVRRSTVDYAMVNQWFLYLGNAANGTVVTSAWTPLPANVAAAVYFVRGDKLWDYNTIPSWNLTVEAEDGTVVLTKDFTQDQVFSFTTKSTPTRYRAKLRLVDGYGLSLKSIYGVLPSFDLFDLRPQGNRGIQAEYRNNVYVKNGRVVQGRGKSLYGHGVYVSGGTGITVENLSVDNEGMEAAGIYINWGNSVKVSGNTVVSRNPYVFARMQLSAAVNVSNGSNLLVTGNTVDAGAGWGGILVSNKDQEISYNTVRTRSTITNHHAIATAGAGAVISPINSRIHHNVIEADPGQGILTAPNGGEVYENDITIRKTGPNFEYGYISFDAITLKDYGNLWCNNLKVYNNRINLYGAYDKYYTGYASGYKVINGIMNMCTGNNVVYDNNTIVARTVDPEVHLTGIEMGGMNDNLVVYRNNFIDSDGSNLVFGGYAGQGEIYPNLLFLGNIFVKGPTSVGYHTLGMERSGNVNTDKIRFVDTKVSGGASLADVQLPGSYGRYSYSVEWSVNTAVRDGSWVPLGNAAVVFRDKDGNTAYSGVTDSTGKIDNVALVEYRRNGNGQAGTSNVTTLSPYTVVITPPGGPPVSSPFALDGKKIVNYQVGGTISVVPNAN
ncbi:MAG: right-handed parallel beta-helix repeat-containing protein [Syntrophales bacterium]